MYYTEKEKPIIEKFFSHLFEIKKDDKLLLIWDECEMDVRLDTAFDDEDEDTKEEFNSVVFQLIERRGKPQIKEMRKIKKGDLFIVNYRNFPKEIRLNGKVIG